MADYIAPLDTGIPGYIGGFACTAGTGIDAHVKRFEDDHDDDSTLMLKALADQLAETLTEMLHARVPDPSLARIDKSLRAVTL